jgi:DNA repair protein RecO (recombination protein O)
MLEKDQIICLRTVDYSETSQILTLFGRDSGKISAIAKGSRRAKSSFEGPVEIFSFGNIVFAKSNSGKLATLTEFQQFPIFRQLRNRLFLLNCGLFASELVDHFTHETDPHPQLFDGFVQFLKDVQESEDDGQALCFLVLFQLLLLEDVGLRPVLNKCSNCKAVFNDSWRAIYFSSNSNGLVCQDCEQSFVDKIRISAAAASCLSDIRNIESVQSRVLKDIEKLLVYHFTAILHRPPRMAKYFV